MIYPATLGDAAACAGILQAWILENPWFPNLAPASASEDAMRKRIESGSVLLARPPQGNIDGFIAFGDGYIDSLYVLAHAQNRGIGWSLLEQAKLASPDGLSLWVLQKNEAAIRFYCREGFVETARSDGSDNEENLPDVQMKWKLEETTVGKPA